ncbi:MAG: hypothetical protein ACXIVF_08530 [Rhizobiaceae bacterium]
MNTNRLLSALVAPLLLAGSALPATASMPRVEVPATTAPFVNASAECFSMGQQVAAREGGTLYNAVAETRGGQRVCVIVVVIPGPEGQRPRRAEFVMPL